MTAESTRETSAHQRSARAGEFAVRRGLTLGLSRSYAIAYVCGLLPAVVLAMVQPVWSRVDEAQHADILAQYSHGVYPVEGKTTIRPETVAVMRATGIYRWTLPGAQPVPTVTDPTQFTPVPPGLSPIPREKWVRHHLWWFSYEAMQPPLYYALATPAWALGDRLGGATAALYAARLFNALLLGCLAPLALFLARRIAPEVGLGAPAATAVVALIPGLVLNGTQVSNDTAAAVLGGLSLVIGVIGLTRGWTAARALLCGLAFGGALASKLTAIGLAPALVIAMMWPGSGRSLLVRLTHGAIAALVAALVITPWLFINHRIYGQFVPSAAAASLLSPFFPSIPPNVAGLLASIKNAFTTFWTGEPHNTFPLVRLTAAVAGAACAGAAIGLWRLLRSRAAVDGMAGIGPWAVLTAAVAGEALWSLVALFYSGVGGFTPGRYLYPAVLAVAVLVAVGLAGLPRRIGSPAQAVLLGCCLFNLVAFSFGWRGTVPETRSSPPASAETHDVHLTGSYSSLVILVDRISVVPRDNVTWVHITASNSGDIGVVWWGSPSGTEAGRGPLGQSPVHTDFPETIPPHTSYTGWAAVRNMPRPFGTHTDLAFGDIATTDYASAADITMPVP